MARDAQIGTSSNKRAIINRLDSQDKKTDKQTGTDVMGNIKKSITEDTPKPPPTKYQEHTEVPENIHIIIHTDTGGL